MDEDTVVIDGKSWRNASILFTRFKFKTLMVLDAKKIGILLRNPNLTYDDLIIKNTKVNHSYLMFCIAMEFKAKRLRLDETVVEWDLEKVDFSIDMKRGSFYYFF